MIYEFKSKATGNLIMTQSVGEMVLDAMNKAHGEKGVITMEEMPACLAALKAAIQASTSAPEAPDDGSQEHAIGLSARALPMLEMLERAHRAGKEITWGT